ncbi:MAG: hypothetical protein V3W34_13645 [Phycisphaerae bacterium]
MTADQLRRAIRAAPFKPFRICLADGCEIRVRHPEFVMVTPEASRTFVVAESGEDYRIIDLLLVTSLDFVDGKPRRTRRKR